MRKMQKKSNIIYYLIGVVLLLAFGFVVFHEMPVKVERVEMSVD